MTSSSRTTIVSTSCAACPARPAIYAARSSPGGNPFEGPRSDHYPNKPIKTALAPGDVRRGREEPRLSSVPGCRSRRRARPMSTPEGIDARRLRILRLLQPHRLRGQRQGVGQHRRSCRCCATEPKFELRTRAFVTQAHLRQAGQARSPASSTPTCAPARNTSSRPASWCCRPTCSATPSSCCSPASASPTIPAPARAWSARTTATSSRRAATAFFEDKEMNPFIGAPGMSVCDRRFQRRELRPFRARLLRRRLHRVQQRRRAADRRARGAARHAALGLGMEARDGQVVSPLHAFQHAGLGLRQRARTSWTSTRPTRMRSAGR